MEFLIAATVLLPNSQRAVASRLVTELNPDHRCTPGLTELWAPTSDVLGEFLADPLFRLDPEFLFTAHLVCENLMVLTKLVP